MEVVGLKVLDIVGGWCLFLEERIEQTLVEDGEALRRLECVLWYLTHIYLLILLGTLLEDIARSVINPPNVVAWYRRCLDPLFYFPFIAPRCQELREAAALSARDGGMLEVARRIGRF